jgi:adenylosuccinate synthase
MKMLMCEIVHIQKYYPDFLDRLCIDPKAGVLDERFHEEEGGTSGEMHRRIGSTGEGVGPARIARLQRDPDKFRLFEDVASEYGLEDCLATNTPKLLARLQDAGANILIEGTQGSALSLLHSHWPYCTSTDTNAAGIIADVGIAPSRVTDVLMVCRTFPIRVAGNSGPMKGETTWEAISERVGHKVEERTTVTKKVRRVAEWDDRLFEQACVLNAPTEIALTFCDYIDPELEGCTSAEELVKSAPLMQFLAQHGLVGRVKYFGCGPDSMVEV